MLGAERRIVVARVVSLVCDKCGVEIRNDMSRVTIWYVVFIDIHD